MNRISKKALIDEDVILGFNVIIGDNVKIGKNVIIGNNTTIDNCIIKNNTTIHDNCIIGYSHATGWVSRDTDAKDLIFDQLIIGENCIIREGCTIYIGSKLGDNVKVHHKVLIREKCIIGDNTSIGSMCDLEGHLTIGNNCSIHSNVHLCYDTTIGDYVFIAPFCITTNGNPMSYKRPVLYEKFGFEKGPTIESGCQIAVHVTILPRVVVGFESMIGANSLITKDVEPLSIMIGSPAKKKGTVEDLYRLPLEIRNKLGIN
jgi:acetyltransferase-like isoleucine patch superfamily enzyme